jgi:uncharacterized protein with HEPN domain
VRRIPDDWLADFPTEPWGQIKAIGNRIRHEYFRVDDAILWAVITTDALALKTVMEAMLARHAGNGTRSGHASRFGNLRLAQAAPSACAPFT